jgi:hypothetical protein
VADLSLDAGLQDTQAIVAIDGSKRKAVNSRDKNFTSRKMAHSMRRIEESIERCLASPDGFRRAPMICTEHARPFGLGGRPFNHNTLQVMIN